jgi:hypothetical protein
MLLNLGSRLFQAGLALSLLGAPSLGRDPTGALVYFPSSQTVEGVPRWVQSYVFSVTADAPATMNVLVKPTNIPGGLVDGIVSEAIARSYVTVTPNTVTFAAGSLTRQISVTVDMPDLGATTDLLFAYSVQVTAGSEVDLNASTHTITARSTVPPSSGNPPVVTIGTPVAGQVFTYSLADLGQIPVPLQFQVVSAADAPISGVEVTLNGNQIIPTLAYSSNGSVADGTASLPILAAGTYTVVVEGYNDHGMAYDSHQFTVNVSGPPPSVAISLPVADSDFTYFVGGPPVVVPNSFSATTPQGTSLQSWQAVLTDPGAVSSAIQITPQVPNGRDATGSVQLALTTSGRYSLGVSASNQYGSASASTRFWINRITNPANQTVDAFQNATFTVSAAGRATYTYQWYRIRAGTVLLLANGGGYSGVTTSVLSVANVTGGMSGDRYYCMITPVGSTGTIRSADAVLTVRKLTPTVNYPTPLPVIYGTALSVVQKNATATYGGAAVSGTITYSPSSGVLPAGNQTLTASFVPTDTENYNSATGSTVLVVTKAVLTVTAENKTKVYGTVNPTLTATIAGFVNYETLATSGVTGAAGLSTTATVLSGVAGSPYSITASLGTLQAANYSFVFVGGLLAITPAPLEIRADNKTMTVGDSLPALTATFVGLVNGETTVPGVSLSTTAQANSPVGTYPISVTVGPVSNYSPISLVNGVLTIAPRTNTDVTISGVVFLDFGNASGLFNGLLDTNEPGLAGITVQLFRVGQATPIEVATQNGGAYSFTVSAGATYTLDVVEPAGMVPTTGVPITVSSSVTQNIGLALYLNAVRGLRGDGYSHGYWKNNIEKWIPGNSLRQSGMQEEPTNLQRYTNDIVGLYLSTPLCFGELTRVTALQILSSTDQLRLQLLASEYNYASGRLINSSRPLTFAFVAWGEFVLNDASSPTPIYNAAYRTYVKDWMDAFNNSHGGLVRGPMAR